MDKENYITKEPHIEFNVLTLFPELFPGSTVVSIVGKALESRIWNLKFINTENFTKCILQLMTSFMGTLWLS